MIRNVTVYCSSSSKVAAVYHQAATDLGRAIAQCGWGLVYGGNHIGLMGLLADAARAGGAKVIGVTPQRFIDDGCGDDSCDELIIPATMRERKQIMEHRGDALLALPGGLGTLEEILEVIVGRQLGYHHKPVVLLNIAGFYDPLLAMIRSGIEQHFIRPRARDAFFVADDVATAIDHLRQFKFAGHPPVAANPKAMDSAAE